MQQSYWVTPFPKNLRKNKKKHIGGLQQKHLWYNFKPTMQREWEEIIFKLIMKKTEPKSHLTVEYFSPSVNYGTTNRFPLQEDSLMKTKAKPRYIQR